MTENPMYEQMLINEQYLTIKKIGQGGFGVVWRAYDFSLRNYVAVKELLKDYTETKYIEMFYKEALIAKNIIHDNIVRVQHFWRGSNGSFYILMDYVSGNDLEHLINKCNQTNTRIPWELGVLICGSILKALDHANRVAKDASTGKPYGIVYRDISPGNIIISFDGNIKLSDFGIAKTADELNSGVKQRIVTGKYGYMSPEQIKGDPNIDHRSDIFSIGIVLYEMLSGRKLYTGDTKSIKQQVMETKFDPSLLTNMGVPEELIGIIGKALEKDKENRYEKAIEMFRDLRRQLRGKETEDLTSELANFMGKVLAEELADETDLIDRVKQLNISDIKSNPYVTKVSCRDFIVGEPVEMPEEPAAAPQETGAGLPAKAITQGGPRQVTPPPKMVTGEKRPVSQQRPISQQKPAPVGEEKGKTVFEEVGDWLVTKFKVYRIRLIRGLIALSVAAVLFLALDTFFHITPVGRNIYSMIYPPDVVITTIPSGAYVTMRDRDGKTILSNVDTFRPVELRKLAPKTYIISAVKEGFKKVEKVVKIEEQVKGSKEKSQQRIDIYFDFVLGINSNPEGATVFIDGNKFAETPCRSELVAGEHTVKLVLKGFQDLGSLAKESKEGQCNIDFTRSEQSAIFGGIDSKYWDYNITKDDNEVVFNLSGHMFKKVTMASKPTGMMVQIDGEASPRGNTPLTVPLKAGEYKMRFTDADGRYAEETRAIRVDSDSQTDYLVHMNKWVTFRVKSRASREEAFIAEIRIVGNGVNIVKDISTAKSLRIPLPVGIYRVTFVGDKEYKPLVMTGVNIAETSAVMGELEYANTQFKIQVRDDITTKPVPDAYVWLRNQLLGKTNEDGVWEKEVAFGTSTVRIVVNGYIEKEVEKYINPGRDGMTISVIPEPSEEPLESTGTYHPVWQDQKKPGKLPKPIVQPQVQKPPLKPKNTTAAGTGILKPPSDTASKNVIVCPNCKKEYVVGPVKLKFCTNCGRPFR